MFVTVLNDKETFTDSNGTFIGEFLEFTETEDIEEFVSSEDFIPAVVFRVVDGTLVININKYYTNFVRVEVTNEGVVWPRGESL